MENAYRADKLKSLYSLIIANSAKESFAKSIAHIRRILMIADVCRILMIADIRHILMIASALLYEIMCVLSHLMKSYMLTTIFIRASYLAYCDIPAIIDITACVRTPCAHLVAFGIKTTSLLTLFAAMKSPRAIRVLTICRRILFVLQIFDIAANAADYAPTCEPANQYKIYYV